MEIKLRNVTTFEFICGVKIYYPEQLAVYKNEFISICLN